MHPRIMRRPAWREIHSQILSAFLRFGVGRPVTLDQIRSQLRLPHDEQRGLPRRVRELRPHGYRLRYIKKSDSYVLESAKPTGQIGDTQPIPGKLRAEVLLAARGRCQMCGKTIVDDEIKLVVDHRIPRAWGGQTVRHNLWAICEHCNISKKDFLGDLDENMMRSCMQFDEPIRRIAAILNCFGGKIVPRQLLEIVGEDEQWTRRLRELRELGWKVPCVSDPDQKGRRRYTYKLVKSAPLPENVPAELKRIRTRKRGR